MNTEDFDYFGGWTPDRQAKAEWLAQAYYGEAEPFGKWLENLESYLDREVKLLTQERSKREGV